MRTVLAILFLLAPLVCAQAQNVEIMYFMDEGAVRSACYYKPAGDGPFPAMIYSAANHHSCESETTPFRVLANFYLKQGIVLVLPGRSPVAKENDKKSSVLHDARLHANHLAATIEGLKTQAFVDPKRIFVSGHQLGAVHTLLLAKETNGVAGYIVFSPAVKMMNDHGKVKQALVKAVSSAKSPVFLIQPQNDFNLAPSMVLGPLISKKGKPNTAKIFPAVGKTQAEGNLMAVTSPQVWGEDVIQFIQQCGGREK